MVKKIREENFKEIWGIKVFKILIVIYYCVIWFVLFCKIVNKVFLKKWNCSLFLNSWKVIYLLFEFKVI